MTGNGRSIRKAGGGGSGPIAEAVPCERITLNAQLTSPQPAVVTSLRVNDVLVVDIVGMQGRNVIQVLKDGQPAGGLSPAEAAKLRDCILRGHKFKATVLEIRQGQVQVYIEHA